jgi:excinuclease ABC subunit C
MNSQQFKKIQLPESPGVYLFKKGKSVLYVGKATSLKDRVKSYFSKDLIATRGPLLVDMVFKADSVEFEETDSVLEALILEAYIIKKLQPKYNTKEKDNKSYNYVVITDEEFPKVLIERGKNLDLKNGTFLDSKLEPKSQSLTAIFGPFPHGAMLKEALKIVRKIFPFIDKQSSKRDNFEFYRQLGLVPNVAPVLSFRRRPESSLRNSGLGSPGVPEDDKMAVVNNVAKLEYQKTIRHIKLFFEGKKKELVKSLEKEMMNLAKKQKFEEANKIKKTLYALNHIRDVSLLKRDMSDVGKALRIEGYDVAHLSGTNMVGVMTVIEDGIPEKTEYKKFNIKTVKGANDPASLKEMFLRRLGHTEWQYPGLIVVDGNEIQLSVVENALATLKINIPVVAVVKDEKHKASRILGDKNLILSYRDQILLANTEAHRFAIAFHRQKRGKLK